MLFFHKIHMLCVLVPILYILTWKKWFLAELESWDQYKTFMLPGMPFGIHKYFSLKRHKKIRKMDPSTVCLIAQFLRFFCLYFVLFFLSLPPPPSITLFFNLYILLCKILNLERCKERLGNIFERQWTRLPWRTVELNYSQSKIAGRIENISWS